MRLLYFILVVAFSVEVNAINRQDTQGCSLVELFTLKNAKYEIRYHHSFTDTLKVPTGCVIDFQGGSLVGPIIFSDTKLKGDINLRGASISGNIKNKRINACWVCYGDGKHDDAKAINEIVEIGREIFFPKGRYLLTSRFTPPKGLPGGIHAHIGVCKSNVSFVGEKGTVFVTDDPMGTICIFSYPHQIGNSTSNISISSISFEVHNVGKNFYEFMHTIRVVGVNGLRIEGCTFNDFWGDAICLSSYNDIPQTGERTRNQNVKIVNNFIVGGSHHSNRNGISVVNGKNVLITGNIIRNTSRKNMPGGIDVEPNNSAYTIENIRIEQNNLDGIWGSNGAISVVSFKDGPVHNITITDNKITNSTCGLYFYLKTEGTTSGYTIKGNYTDEKTVPYRFVGSGSSMNWCVTGNHFKRRCSLPIPGDIKVENLKVRKNKIATDGK